MIMASLFCDFLGQIPSKDYRKISQKSHSSRRVQMMEQEVVGEPAQTDTELDVSYLEQRKISCLPRCPETERSTVCGHPTVVALSYHKESDTNFRLLVPTSGNSKCQIGRQSSEKTQSGGMDLCGSDVQSRMFGGMRRGGRTYENCPSRFVSGDFAWRNIVISVLLLFTAPLASGQGCERPPFAVNVNETDPPGTVILSLNAPTGVSWTHSFPANKANLSDLLGFDFDPVTQSYQLVVKETIDIDLPEIREKFGNRTNH
ncbi:uncharacterized protein LOC101852773, partial [Aplysia californica]|uniref:Uncharacterized protein LOC101852773 n=1 Tax=Aplysia californica TaxID=6500 RepID=A0ABM0JTV3_APLCA